MVRLKFGPRSILFLNEPDAIRHVFVENHGNYVKGFGYDKLEPILGRGLLTSEGGQWRRSRKLAQPAFHRARLEGLGGAMVEAARDLVAKWEPVADSGQPLEIVDEMMRLTLRVVSVTLLGFDIGQGESKAVSRALSNLLVEANRRILSLMPFPIQVPTPRNLKSKVSIKVLNELVYRIIAEHRAGKGKGVLLQMLMDARDEENGQGLSDGQLRDEVMTMFLAGHETTANALSWMLYLLSKHPAVDRKLHAELQEVLGGREPTMADLPKLRYTTMVIEESLRLYPPAWIFSRQAVGADVVAGYGVAPGTIVAVSPYVLHRSTAYWENPEGFDPERFTDDKKAERPKHAYLPFGAGPRSCIGNHFALMEMQIALAMIASRYRAELVPGHTVEPEPLITLRPRYGLQMRLRSRGTSQTAGRG